MQQRVVVIGGGVSGLATAWHLSRAGCAGRPLEVTLLEATEHVGGWIRTVDVGALTGRPTQPVDVGPDSLLVRAPAVSGLLGELGLAGARRPPSGAGAYIWVRGGLHRLPRSSVFGVPDSPLRLARSGLVSPLGMLRAAADLVLPRSRLGDDPSIAELLRPRLGGEVFANLVEPMLGGVHAGRADRLSACSAVPEVFAVAGRHRSILRAVRRLEPRTGAGPALAGFEGGMVVLVEALARTACEAGVRVRTSSPVAALERDGAGYRVLLDGGEVLAAERVVLAVPAHGAAALLRPVAAAAAAAAAQIRYAGVATVSLVYDRERFTATSQLPPGTGFLVPPNQGRLLVGCTWLTAKWPQPPDAQTVVIRAMVGRDGDARWAALDDVELEAAIVGELCEAMAMPRQVLQDPLTRIVRRMPNALPQYTIGHSARLAAIEEDLAGAPGLVLTGAGYRGLGLAACLTSAEQTAAAVLGPAAGSGSGRA